MNSKAQGGAGGEPGTPCPALIPDDHLHQTTQEGGWKPIGGMWGLIFTASLAPLQLPSPFPSPIARAIGLEEKVSPINGHCIHFIRCSPPAPHSVVPKALARCPSFPALLPYIPLYRTQMAQMLNGGQLVRLPRVMFGPPPPAHLALSLPRLLSADSSARHPHPSQPSMSQKVTPAADCTSKWPYPLESDGERRGRASKWRR